MGFFSWKTSDTDESISNASSERGALPCYLLIPKEFGGGSIYEDKYEGYGMFGGRDAYALVALSGMHLRDVKIKTVIGYQTMIVEM